MRNVQAHAVQGQQLPRDWRIQASLRAHQASSDYMQRLQNAWKGPLTTENNSELMKARLRPTSDARCDALRLVVDDDAEEVWEAPGVTVRKKK